MNQERLIKIIEDLQECIGDIKECMEILSTEKENKIILKLAKSSLTQLFVSFHTILEDLCSILLKEMGKYKIGITLYDSFEILKDNNCIDEGMYEFFNKSRLIRNRISHRYKEPTYEELFSHINKYFKYFDETVNLAKKDLIA